jgi:Flp pilus assembly protein TadG
MRKLLSLRHDTAGAAVIELALAAPIMAAVLIGMSEIATGFSTKLQLEQAAQSAIEKVMQGQTRATTASVATLKTDAATLAGVTEANVTVSFTLFCVNRSTNVATAASDYNTVCAGTEDTRRYMKVVITKDYTPMMTRVYAAAGTNNVYTLTGQTSVRVQ